MDNLFLLFCVGFIAGIFTGFFGVGGGFFLTPVLNILGLPIVYAIGTCFFTLIGKSLFGAWRHLKHGNVILKLGIILGMSSMGGVEIGKRFVLYLEKHNLAETYIRITYIVILVLMSFLMMSEYHFQRKKSAANQKGESAHIRGKKLYLLHLISKINLSPIITLTQSKSGSISVWVLIVFGVLIGFLSGILGVGGGFISLPILIYLIEIPTILAVGTSLIIVFFTSSYGAFAYAITGYVEWITAVVIFVGSLLGIQMGVIAVKSATEMRIKVLFALLLLSVAVSLFLKHIGMTLLGSFLVVSTACALCLIIIWPVNRYFFAKILSRNKPKSPS